MITTFEKMKRKRMGLPIRTPVPGTIGLLRGTFTTEKSELLTRINSLALVFLHAEKKLGAVPLPECRPTPVEPRRDLKYRKPLASMALYTDRWHGRPFGAHETLSVILVRRDTGEPLRADSKVCGFVWRFEYDIEVNIFPYIYCDAHAARPIMPCYAICVHVASQQRAPHSIAHPVSTSNVLRAGKILCAECAAQEPTQLRLGAVCQYCVREHLDITAAAPRAEKGPVVQ